MGSTDNHFLKTTELDVQELCDQYRALDQRRLELDQHITASPKGDQDREALWQEQEAVLRELRGLTMQLSALPAINPGGLRGKADVLARLLRASGIDTAAIDRRLWHWHYQSPAMSPASCDNRPPEGKVRASCVITSSMTSAFTA
jgi:hypothetical protein